ncbi:MAG: NAD(P)/FAD-dependent oxidoreductase [Gammaproteobacteria bacterium]
MNHARQHIAIIGSGISGMTAAYLLSRRHDVTVFEAADWVGGHTHTVDVEVQGKSWAVDTGFIVCNDRTYPNFLQLLGQIGVARRPSQMGFSVECERTGLAWAGGNLDQVFAQRRNLLSPSFIRMLRDILRFNRDAPALLDSRHGDFTLGEYLEMNRYSAMFRDYYILPMGAAIWSCGVDDMLDFPAHFFIRFFNNHGLLSISNRPQWYVIEGGSRAYVEPLTRGFRDRIRLQTPVAAVQRDADGVNVLTERHGTERFDSIVFACHSDQVLAILGDGATADERRVLGAIPYQENDVVLHTDTTMLPALRKTWSSWNYRLPKVAGDRVQLSYNMNILQSLAAPETFCITLNPGQPIDPARVLGRYTYHHPVYTLDGMKARARKNDICGMHHTHYCGAYWHNGFHEDGVVSALSVAAKFGERL